MNDPSVPLSSSSLRGLTWKDKYTTTPRVGDDDELDESEWYSTSCKDV